jgi:TRAP-type C4-dicarboxylate transport system substrate-binding protein
MRVARRTLLASILASVASPAVLRRARADTVTLKLHHFFSSVASGHEKFLAPWARKVEADSGGRIRIDIFPSMQLGGAPAQLLDQAREGLAEIVWALPGDTPGRFAPIEAFELPFVPSRRALVNSKAIEDYAAANLRDEVRDLHSICFSCRDRAVLHAKHTIQSIRDLRALRLHVPNRLAASAVRALGADGVRVPTLQVPMALSRHVIDGCLDPWDLVPSLRLNDLLKTHTDFAESSLSTEVFVLAMNKRAYERLPRDLKTILDGNSGQFAATMAGAMWDREASALAVKVAERGEPVSILPPEEVARWRRVTEPVIASWVKQMKQRSTDGGKLLADARTLLAKYENEPEPEPAQAANAAPRLPQSVPQAKAGASGEAAPAKELEIPL